MVIKYWWLVDGTKTAKNDQLKKTVVKGTESNWIVVFIEKRKPWIRWGTIYKYLYMKQQS